MIGAALRRLVRNRADRRCEYCSTRQGDEPFVTYRVEHVIARQHRGKTEESNLALSRSHCNLHKGPNLAGIDPGAGKIEPLFHPRLQIWTEHFAFVGLEIIGITPIGRATVEVLAMNAIDRIELRQAIANTLS